MKPQGSGLFELPSPSHGEEGISKAFQKLEDETVTYSP